MTKAWKKMSISEKRVAIARDVLKQIKKKKILPMHSCYVDSIIYKGNSEIRFDQNIQLNKITSKIKDCEACAVGSLFLCAIDRNNHFDLKQAKLLHDGSGGYPEIQMSPKPIFAYLKRFFTIKQIQLIEIAFEGYYSGNFGKNIITFKESEKAMDFRDGTLLSERLVCIMKNIIENKGTFKP